MILYSYFLILGKIIGNNLNDKSYIENIDFCSASNKLKVYNGPKIILEEKKSKSKKKIVEPIIEEQQTNEQPVPEQIVEIKEKKGSAIKYADKKRLAIEHAKYYLQNQDPKYLEFFNSHKKKDDLSDSFLQGLYYLSKTKK
jgi:hypothetical protein